MTIMRYEITGRDWQVEEFPDSGDYVKYDDVQRQLEQLPDRWSLPAPTNRPDGLEVLAWHRGSWRHVSWMAGFGAWSLGYDCLLIGDGERAFAPLPPKPEEGSFFWRWEE